MYESYNKKELKIVIFIIKKNGKLLFCISKNDNGISLIF